MMKYVCSVCGYIYDEAKGIPEAGIAAGTPWDTLPDSWICPLCRAPKSEFREVGETISTPPTAAESTADTGIYDDLKELTSLEMSALCSNLARGCEKQYLAKESDLFAELSSYFKAASTPAQEPASKDLLALIEKDLAEHFPEANAVSGAAHDRGALRALTWSEKVTRMLKSLLSRYETEGSALFANTNIYVCTICGFIYLGDTPPELCPVCKVQNWKFEKMEGRNS